MVFIWRKSTGNIDAYGAKFSDILGACCRASISIRDNDAVCSGLVNGNKMNIAATGNPGIAAVSESGINKNLGAGANEGIGT